MRIRHNLKKVTQNFNEYKPKIKIINGSNESVWIDVTKEQLLEIKDIIIGGL